jgi:polysaccharide export outer membrane protein
MIMMNPLKMMARLAALCGAVLVASMLTGCQTTSTDGDGAFAQVPGMPGNSNAVPQTGSTAAVAGVTQPGPGASTNSPFSSDILRINDSIKVIFSDLPIPQPPFEERVKEDGTITLLQNQTFTAAGKSRGELEKEIRARYVPSFFKNLTVTIQPQERFYFVDGEVKEPNRQIYLSSTTVLKAIASSKGFTDFADKAKVRVIRADGTTQIVNCKRALKDPRLDLEVFPGDTVIVPRSIW